MIIYNFIILEINKNSNEPFQDGIFSIKNQSFLAVYWFWLKIFPKNFLVFKETAFLVCYAKSQFEIRALDGWSNLHIFFVSIDR